MGRAETPESTGLLSFIVVEVLFMIDFIKVH